MDAITTELVKAIGEATGAFLIVYIVYKVISLIIFWAIIRNAVWQGTEIAIQNILYKHNLINDKNNENNKDNT